MFGSPKPLSALDPVRLSVQEAVAHDALYGPHTLPGDVTRVIDYCDEPWMHWNGIQWEWPENPEMTIDGHARVAEINIALIMGSDFGFSWAV